MIKVAVLNIFRNKSRAVLSLLGIVIGVAAIITMVSVVDGMVGEVENAFSNMQGVTIFEEGQIGIFSEIDISYGSKLEAIPGVESAVPTIVALANSVDGKSGSLTGVPTRLIGIGLEGQKMKGAAGFSGEIVSGRELKAGDTKAVLISKQYAEDNDKFVGNRIKINGKAFKIMGTYETGSSILNTVMIMPIDDLRDLVGFANGKVTQYSLSLRTPEDDQKIAKIINFKYGDDLMARSASDFSSQIGDVLGSLRLLVGAVAAIAAIVAGVGILNTMLMSVVERFQEIGSLKAVGWTNNDIMKMILYESALIGIFGGILGIIFGIIGAGLIQDVAGLTTLVSPALILQAFFFALFIGVFAGFYPAYAASKMDPVDALRAE
ncbi:MAG: FtsX-like permease family protein [Candidatus Diapherotrites archaeon]